MRAFSSGVRLWDLARETKLVFSAYVLFSLLGLLTAALYSLDLAGGRGLQQLGEYYGSAAGSAELSAEVDLEGGPSIETAPQDEGPLVIGVSYRKLLEVSHFHFFMVPVLLVILSHLFLFAGLRPAIAMGWVAAAWGMALLHLLAPWLIHYGSSRLTVLMPLSGVGMLSTATVLCVVTVYRMWRRPAVAK